MIVNNKQKIIDQILKLKLVNPLNKIKIQKLQQELDNKQEEISSSKNIFISKT
jgi:hypothetical protein